MSSMMLQKRTLEDLDAALGALSVGFCHFSLLLS